MFAILATIKKEATKMEALVVAEEEDVWIWNLLRRDCKKKTKTRMRQSNAANEEEDKASSIEWRGETSGAANPPKVDPSPKRSTQGLIQPDKQKQAPNKHDPAVFFVPRAFGFAFWRRCLARPLFARHACFG